MRPLKRPRTTYDETEQHLKFSKELVQRPRNSSGYPQRSQGKNRPGAAQLI